MAQRQEKAGFLVAGADRVREVDGSALAMDAWKRRGGGIPATAHQRRTCNPPPVLPNGHPGTPQHVSCPSPLT